MESVDDKIREQLTEELNALRARVKELERAETRRESQHEWFHRTLFNQSYDAIIIEDLDEKIVDANPVACRLFGYSRDEMLALHTVDLQPSESLGSSPRAVYAEARNGSARSERFETTLLRRDNTPINAEVMLIPLTDGDRVLFLSIIRDMTREKQAAEAMARLRHQNALILEAAGEGICGVDTTGNTLFINPAGAAMLGYSAGELTGRKFHDLCHHSRADGAPYPAEDCPAIVTPRDGLSRSIKNELFWRKDGTGFPVDYTCTPMVEHGAMVGAVVTFRDITDRKQTEDALAYERNMLRTVIDHLPDYIFVKDMQGRFLLYNAAGIKLLGKDSLGEILGKTSADFYPPGLAETFENIDKAVTQSGKALFNLEHTVTDPKGNQVHVLVTKVPLRNADGQITGLIGIGRDVTERKRTEDALAHYAKRLDILHRLDQGVLAGLATDEIAVAALPGFCQLVPCRSANITLFDFEQNDALAVAVSDYGETTLIAGSRIPLDELRLPADLHRGRQIMIDDLAALPDPNPIQQRLVAEGVHAYLTTPLIVEDELIGELSLGSDMAKGLGIAHRVIATQFADQLTIVISHIRLREQVQHHNAELQERVQERTAELDRTRSRVEAILNNSSDAILLARADGAISQTNLTFDRLFGYDVDDLFHQPLTSIAHLESADRLEQAIHDVVHNGTIQQLEIVARREDQSSFDAEVALSLIRVSAGQRGGIVCHLRDITERKRAEIALHESEERYRSLFEYAPISLWEEDFSEVKRYIDRLRAMGVTDFDTYFKQHPRAVRYCASQARVLQINQATLTLFQIDSQDQFYQNLRDVVNTDGFEHFREELVMLASGATRFEHEQLDRTTTGQIIHTVVGVSLVPGYEEDWSRLLVYVVDITERKRAEEELRRALDRERELSDLKTRFVSMASHEFRTPLTTIVSSTEILENYIERMQAEQKKRHFEKIQIAAQHMTQLLDDVLLYGKADAEQLQLDLTTFDLKPLAQEILEQARLGAPPNLVFDVTLECGVVTLDKMMTRHILNNLLTNAIKYSPEGGSVAFSVQCAGDNLVIRVEDQGIGIPARDREHLFEPFHRAHNVDTIQGTGLGLAITKRAVDLHHGLIEVESAEGVGSTFTITIPISEQGGSPSDEDSRS